MSDRLKLQRPYAAGRGPIKYWAEIKNDYFCTDFLPKDGDILASVSIDAWKSPMVEQGSVIASVMLSKQGDILVDYLDPVARIDEAAQEAIAEAKGQLMEFYKEKQKIDLSLFNEEQAYELQKGLELGLPIQIYANPCFSAQEMANIRNILETAAYAQAYPDKRVVVTDYGPEELCLGFRSDSNFAHHPERICYVPENYDLDEGFGYTGKDFLNLCNGDARKAQALFDACDWQHPETVLDEWEREEIYNELERELSVKTELGELVATIKEDSTYPGIAIGLRGKGVNAQYTEDYVGLAWVEFTPEKNNIQTVVYGDGNKDEFTHLVEHKNIRSHEMTKPSLDTQIQSAARASSTADPVNTPKTYDPER